MFKSVKTSFVLRKNKKRKTGKCPIYLRISVDKHRTEISTKKLIEEKSWDYSSQKVKGRTPKVTSINNYLEQLKKKVLDAETSLYKEGREITTVNIREKLLGKNKPKVDLFAFFVKHNARLHEEVGKRYSLSTYKKYQTCLKHLRSFVRKKFNSDKYLLSAVDIGFIRDYEHYLKTKKKPCNHNSTLKYISHLQKVINEALEREIITKDPFLKYNEKYDEKDPVFLTFQELHAIQSKQMPVDRLTRIKDIFIFSCYTGLSYIDVTQLKKTTIEIDSKGEAWIYVHRQKTKEPSMIPLLPVAKGIIDKYEDDPETENGNLLPYKSNQKTNAYLKEIAAIAGVEKHLTFHVARHTFATTVALENEVPMETVQKILGHKDSRSTMHYARVTRQKIRRDMKNLKKKLKNV